MDEDKLEITLNKLGIKQLTRRGQNIMGCCPSGNHTDRRPSWGISVNEPHLHACFSCGFKGVLTTLLVEVGNMTFSQARVVTGDSAYEKEKMLALSLDKRGADKTEAISEDNLLPFYVSKRLLTYMALRNVSEATVRAAGLLYDKRQRRVVFPWRLEGKLVAVTGRALLQRDAKAGMKSISYVVGMDKRSLLYCPQGTIGPSPLVLVEGEIDALRVYDAGHRNVVAVGHSRLSEPQAQLLLRSPCREVWVFADDDDAGNKLRDYTARAINGKKICRQVSYAAANRKNYRKGASLDPGLLTNEDILACLKPDLGSLFPRWSQISLAAKTGSIKCA